jgi:uncharacterized protein with PIN domain
VAKKPVRPRTERRTRERDLRKGIRKVEALARALPGGSAATPIDVATSSLVELQARTTRCPQCNGELEIRGDRAESTPRGVLRAMDLVCRLCHAPRTVWFRVTPAQPD